MTGTYDSVVYQTTLAQTYANIKTVLQRRLLDPLSYIVEIDAGSPIFELRSTHQLRIAYNRFAALPVEVGIPREWMEEGAGKGHDDFMRLVDDMVLELKIKAETAGRPI